MNIVYTSTLISTLLTDDDLPGDYTTHPEKYFVSLNNTRAKQYTKSHLDDKDTEYIPGVVLLRYGENQMLSFEHETADVLTTWVELTAMTRSCMEGFKRLTFIMDSPYELGLDWRNDMFILTVSDRSHSKGTSKSYSIKVDPYLEGIRRGAIEAYEFFGNMMKNSELEELRDHIIFLHNLSGTIK